jgi:non-ribosomal peptide synthase protein (TIGR01720 family)
MVPSAIVVLERLPLTPNGKLDRRGLPVPEVVSGRLHRSPRTPQEAMLCGLYAELLGVGRVGIDDNFFELGGDSIVSIQLVSRARRAGLSITPRAVFQYQTVEALAAVAGDVAATAAAQGREVALDDVGVGEFPATPIMRWLRERGGPTERFSQAMLLRVPGGLSEDDLRAALAALLDHHDALRLRLDAGGADGAWRLEIAPPGVGSAGAWLRRVAIGELDDAGLRDLIAAEAQAAEARLSPAAGVMLQAVWFDAGAGRPGRLLLAIHHLAVDGVSWRILVPDLAAAWRALATGQVVALPPRGTSFRRWAERLALHARDAGVAQELAFWREVQTAPSLLLVADRLDVARDVAGTAGHLMLSLPPAVTQALLTRVPAVFHGGIDDVLLTGLALAVADWCRRRGGAMPGAASSAPGSGLRAVAAASHAVLLDLEGHGREEALGREEAVGNDEGSGAVDLTRTVGWFTSLYPVRLDPGPLDLDEALAGGPSLGRALKTIKEQMRAVPGKGLGYGLLRYLNGATAAELAGVPAPQLGFNYLGRFAAGRDGADWAAADEGQSQDGGAPLGGGDPAMPLAHVIEINALTLDGPAGPALTAHFSFASALLDEAAVRDLAESWLRTWCGMPRCLAPAAGRRATSRSWL